MARTSNELRAAQRTAILNILKECKSQKLTSLTDIMFSIQEQMGDCAPHFSTIKKPHFSTIKKIVMELAPTIKLNVVIKIGRPKDDEAWKIARLAFFNGIQKGLTTHAEMVQYVKGRLEAKGIERSRPDDIVREFRELYSKDLEVRAYTKSVSIPETAAAE